MCVHSYDMKRAHDILMTECEYLDDRVSGFLMREFRKGSAAVYDGIVVEDERYDSMFYVT